MGMAASVKSWWRGTETGWRPRQNGGACTREGHRDGMAASAKRMERGTETGEGHRMGTRGHAPRKGHHWGEFTGNMGSVTGVQ